MSNAPVADGHVPPGARQSYCGAKKRNGTGTCRLPAGHGTDHVGFGHCRRHGGSTPTQARGARRQQAEQAVQTYGLPRDVDPHTALIEELQWTAGHVEYLRAIVQGLDQGDLHGPVGGGKDSHPRAEPNVFVRLYQEERLHLIRVAKTCGELGIAERQVQISEDIGRRFVVVIDAIVRALGLDPAAPEVRQVVRRELTVIAGGGT